MAQKFERTVSAKSRLSEFFDKKSHVRICGIFNCYLLAGYGISTIFGAVAETIEDCSGVTTAS